MSLVVWLPLNGNSKNQGTKQYTETTNTLGYTINGKVTEKCVNKGKLIYNKNPLQMVGTVCFWLYPKSTAEGNDGKTNLIFGNDSFSTSERKWSLYMFPNNKSLHSWGCQKEGSNAPNGSFTYNNVLKESTWNHVCVAHDLKNEYIYVNGNLIGTVPWDSSGTYNFDKETDIIRDETFETGTNNFKINDFRIYDTCLSKAEVSEIAKGLMLHYSFENPYAEETTNIPHSLMIHDNNSGEATLGSDSTGNYVNKTGMTLWSGIGIADTLVKSGRYYTWSMEVMPIKDIEYVIDGNGECSNSSHASSNDIHFDIIRGYSHLNHKLDGSDTLSKGKLEAYKWTRIYFTVKVKQDCTNPYISHTFVPYIPSGDSSVKVYYRNSQLEEKPYDTPYTSSNREARLIRDNSGMGNDGTQVYQREEIPITPKTQTTSSSVPQYGGYTNVYDSNLKTYTINNFSGADNQTGMLGTIKYLSRYHYLNSKICYEFDIKLQDITVTDGKTIRILQQGPTVFKDDTHRWLSSPVQGVDITSRLKNGTTGVYHVCIERIIDNADCVTNVDYYEFGLRFDYVKSGTVTVSNLHAYYQNLDTSTLSLSDNSAIGTHSAYFNGKNFIDAGVVTPDYMDELTLSCWVYKEDWTKPIVAPQYSRIAGCIDWGGFGIGIDRDCHTLLNEVCNDTVGNGANYIRFDNKFDLRTFSQGWHQIAIVCNKNTAITYIDGKEYCINNHNSNLPIRVLSSYKSSDGKYITLPFLVGAEIDGVKLTSPTYTKISDMYVDDVRLYAIALSEEDIKSLYNVKTKIDNKSNLYCNQLVETKSENMMKPLNEVDLDNDLTKFYSSGTFSYKDGIIKYIISNPIQGQDTRPGMYIKNSCYGGRLVDNKRYKYSFWVRVSKKGTYFLGEERIPYVTKSLESGKWYYIEREGLATGVNANFIIYNNSKNYISGDTIEIRDVQIYRLYDENYNPGPNIRGQYKTFELNETFNEDVENSGATIVDKYGAEWLEVFYHNTNNNTVWFTDEQEALHTNSQYKFSILDQLENFRGTDNKFEFLLEYPQDLPGQYNRWKQTDNPALVQELSNSTPSPANGYEAIHVDWTPNGWGGLLKSQKGSTSSPIRTFIDGSTNYGNWFYAIGCYNNKASDWENAMPGPNNTPSTGMKEVNLYVRIDNLENKNEIFRQYKRQTKTKEIIEI